jgi:pimeloyl-ACP methyl ester carboxylesterase
VKVVINNQLVEYSDEGSGKILLFLHGWGANLKTFDTLARHFVDKFRVIRLDFPGFGGSPKPENDWFIDDYSKLTAEFLKKIDASKVYSIVAHSFGGRVAIRCSSANYLDPKKIILMGAAGIKPRKTFKMIAYKIIAKAGKLLTSLPLLSKLQPLLRKKLYSSIGNTDYSQANDMKKIFVNTINEDLLPELSKMNQSTLLIWGENDKDTPLSDAHLMSNLIKASKLRVIPNAGHFVYLDSPDEVKRYMDDFLL